MSSPHTPDDMATAQPQRRPAGAEPEPAGRGTEQARRPGARSHQRRPAARPAAVRPTVYVGARLLVRSVKLDDEVLPPLNQAATESACGWSSTTPTPSCCELARQATAWRSWPCGCWPPGCGWSPPATSRPRRRTPGRCCRTSGPSSARSSGRQPGEPGPPAHRHRRSALRRHLRCVQGGAVHGGAVHAVAPHDGVPYMGGGSAGVSSQYGMPGHGGRAPVTWLGAPPTRCAEDDAALPPAGGGRARHRRRQAPLAARPIVERHPHVGEPADRADRSGHRLRRSPGSWTTRWKAPWTPTPATAPSSPG